MKKTRGRAALYDPYLDIVGGGEKHILSILKIFDEIGYNITIFWDEDISKKIYDRFRIRFNHLSFAPNIFRKKGSLKKLFALKQFDHFFYVTDGSYFFSPAKKNHIFAMVPQKNLYTPSLFDRLKLVNASFISNSRFTKSHLREWGIESEVIYPYVEDVLLATDIKNMKKEKIILSVGRFFPHLHSKKMDAIVESFKRLKKTISAIRDYRLVIAGGLKKEDEGYFHSLQKTAGDDSSIILQTNISHAELIDLYRKSEIYWHFTGFGVDDGKHPESVEHLGIAPLEAMAAGCVTFCVNAGGPKEIITDGRNGFLFADEKELEEKTSLVLNAETLRKDIISKAQKYIKEHFSYSIFKKRVEEIILHST